MAGRGGHKNRPTGLFLSRVKEAVAASKRLCDILTPAGLSRKFVVLVIFPRIIKNR